MMVCRRLEIRCGKGMVIVEPKRGCWFVIRIGIRSFVLEVDQGQELDTPEEEKRNLK
jgi:hypothetical protein